jgi:indole-3-glycerol phosphate synthase
MSVPDRPDVLQQILIRKRQEVSERVAAMPLDEMKRRAADVDRPRNFFAAMTREPADGKKLLNVIAEVKRASPSAGTIRGEINPAAVARQYHAGGADAISVLTDGPGFGGSLDDLRAVRAAMPLPVLRKDFTIDAYQIYEARAAGADAVLLIAEALETNELIDLQILATELRMTTLLEVHSAANFMRVRDNVIGFPHKSYSLFGINNRDLATFETSLGTTLRLAELVEDPTTLVSESGIKTRQDVEKLAAAGVRGALVGETLMRSDDPATTLRTLFHT